MSVRLLAMVFAIMAIGIASADAQPSARDHYARKKSTVRVQQADDDDDSRPVRRSYRKSTENHGVGERPRQWCGWWMRTQRGGGPELNLAWNWSRWGRPTTARIGAVVVWPHHVGEIVGKAPNGQWIVRSGNDGGAVRTRARSVAGAVFRI